MKRTYSFFLKTEGVEKPRKKRSHKKGFLPNAENPGEHTGDSKVNLKHT